MAENKRFYWLKLKRDFFKRHDIRIIEEMPNGKDYILFYLKLLLESIDHEGELRFSETIPYDEKMLSVVTNTNVDIVRSAMKIFTELQMIDVLEDRTIFMNETNKLLGSESVSAERVRNHREKQRMLQCNAEVTKCNTEIEKETDKELKSKSNNKKAASPLDGVLSEIENEELRQTYADYIEMRKTIKAPMTERALRLLMNRVDSLETSVDGKCSLLETAILNNWKSVYAPKNEPQKKQDHRNPKKSGFMDELQSMYDELLEE